jgi:CBS domain containing-hemolysin-like protein
MTPIITALILSLIAVLSMNLRRIYTQVPLKELKRRASKGDQTAQGLFLVSHHGVTADRFLLVVAIICGALATVIAGRTLNMFWALVFVIALIILLLAPFRFKKFHPMDILAQKSAPCLGQLLGRVRPAIQKLNRSLQKRRPVTIHTGLYEKEDLATLIESQKVAINNRIAQTELDIALHALMFGDKRVKDHMTPKRMVRFVGRDEPVGPVLMGELHDSGFSRFPVTGSDDNEIVGTLYLRDLVERKKPGLISNVMSSSVYFVNESAPLERVFNAFIKTKHHLFMVVNEFEEVIGLITIEDVIEQVLGRKIVDEFDKYEDLRAVAELNAKKDQAKHLNAKVVK